jgi:hypothetical protein
MGRRKKKRIIIGWSNSQKKSEQLQDYINSHY